MKFRSNAVLFAAFLGVYAAPAFSHHAAIEFDTDVVLEYEGVVSEFVWANPHIRLILETQTDAGTPITLDIEGNSPTTLRTMGVSADSLVPGEIVTAMVSPSRRFPESSAMGLQFVKEDGSLVPFTTNRGLLAEIGNQPAIPSPVEQSAFTIFQTWVARGGPAPLTRASREWPLTAQGRERLESYTPLMSPQAQCIPTSAPWLMAYSAASVFQQLNDRILFKSDWMRAERTIYMDGRDHPPASETFPQGHSVGRWDDDSLVVESTNFTESIFGGMPNSEQKMLVERFTLSDDGQGMNYSFVMEDPEYIVGEVSGAVRFDYRPDLSLENEPRM